MTTADDVDVLPDDEITEDDLTDVTTLVEATGLGEPAGFWRRAGALAIDSLLLGIGYSVVATTALLAGSAMAGADASSAVALSALDALNYVWPAVGLVYYALLESSRDGATFGKRALGVRVLDDRGDGISIGRALGRTLAKVVSGLLLGIGFLMAGVRRDKRALHDLLAGTQVLVERPARFWRWFLGCLILAALAGGVLTWARVRVALAGPGLGDASPGWADDDEAPQFPGSEPTPEWPDDGGDWDDTADPGQAPPDEVWTETGDGWPGEDEVATAGERDAGATEDGGSVVDVTAPLDGIDEVAGDGTPPVEGADSVRADAPGGLDEVPADEPSIDVAGDGVAPEATAGMGSAASAEADGDELTSGAVRTDDAASAGAADADVVQPPAPEVAAGGDRAAPAAAGDPAEVAAPMAPRRLSVDALLSLAELQFAGKKLTSPAGDNAAETYKLVLARDAGNVFARQGLARIERQYLTWARAALDRGDTGRASDFLARAQAVGSGDPTVDAELSELRGRLGP